MLTRNTVVITVAINGGMQQDRDGAVIPKQPDEIAEAARRCWQAGAAVVHVHARDRNGKNSSDPAIYSAIISKIRARCPILIQTTNGIGVRRDPITGSLSWPSDAERLGILNIEPKQDLFGIATGSMDYYNPEGGYIGETPLVNSNELLRRTIETVYSLGAALEYEIIEASSLHRLRRLAAEGVFDHNRDNIWLLHGGGYGSTPPIARNVIFSIDEGIRLFPNAIWGITGSGHDMFKLGTLGLSMGCDVVRVGFEDGIHLADGTVARENSDMVEQIVAIAKLFGREPATVDEARERLQIRNRLVT
jgi:3-keto-5-aminohexanoate cleavage enzyme